MKDSAKQVAAMDEIRDNPRYVDYKNESSGDLAFALWLLFVDKRLRPLGVSHSDLADFNSYDLYEAGVSPREGAQECLEGDDTYSMFMRSGEFGDTPETGSSEPLDRTGSQPPSLRYTPLAHEGAHHGPHHSDPSADRHRPAGREQHPRAGVN